MPFFDDLIGFWIVGLQQDFASSWGWKRRCIKIGKWGLSWDPTQASGGVPAPNSSTAPPHKRLPPKCLHQVSLSASEKTLSSPSVCRHLSILNGKTATISFSSLSVCSHKTSANIATKHTLKDSINTFWTNLSLLHCFCQRHWTFLMFRFAFDYHNDTRP